MNTKKIVLIGACLIAVSIALISLFEGINSHNIWMMVFLIVLLPGVSLWQFHNRFSYSDEQWESKSYFSHISETDLTSTIHELVKQKDWRIKADLPGELEIVIPRNWISWGAVVKVSIVPVSNRMKITLEYKAVFIPSEINLKYMDANLTLIKDRLQINPLPMR